MQGQSRIRNIKPELAIGGAILVVFVLLCAIQVILRYVFRFSFPWVEELLGILLVWMTFIGAAGLARTRQHIRVEIIEEFLPKKWVRVLEVSYNLITIVYLSLVAWGGLQLWQRLRLQRTPAMRIPLRYVALVVPITAVLMGISYARHIVSDLRGAKGEKTK